MNAFHFLIRRPLLLACISVAASSGSQSAHNATHALFERPASATVYATDSSASREGFHLGTAAGPFGWSSAVADFDDDGRPDFAVADRVEAPADGGYRYRILFGVAGNPSRAVSFDSSSPALTVAIEDVDDDHDLDVLVTDAPSSVVDTVWLNDGHGRFVPRHDRTSPGSRLSTSSVTAASNTDSAAAAPPDAGSSLNPARTVVEILRDTGPTSASGEFAIPSSLARATPSRAPPAI